MTVKFYFYGVRADGVLYRARYSMGPYSSFSKLPIGTITMYAKDYATEFPKIEGTAVENNSGSTDEKETLRIFPTSPYYGDAKRAFDRYTARLYRRKLNV
jgi:hypothetical protein